MNINWSNYSVPYQEALLEVPQQIDYIFNTRDSSEEVAVFLYSELFPNVKHQSDIYSIILPVMDTIEEQLALNKEFIFKQEILTFLSLVFIC